MRALSTCAARQLPYLPISQFDDWLAHGNQNRRDDGHQVTDETRFSRITALLALARPPTSFCWRTARTLPRASGSGF
jgi:hypothetical protein